MRRRCHGKPGKRVWGRIRRDEAAGVDLLASEEGRRATPTLLVSMHTSCIMPATSAANSKSRNPPPPVRNGPRGVRLRFPAAPVGDGTRQTV
jgi:hypothetical protein